jgi:hypothetical protein
MAVVAVRWRVHTASRRPPEPHHPPLLDRLEAGMKRRDYFTPGYGYLWLLLIRPMAGARDGNSAPDRAARSAECVDNYEVAVIVAVTLPLLVLL